MFKRLAIQGKALASHSKAEKMANATVSGAGLRVVRLLIGTEPKSVADLIEATGVTRTAVTEQLNELITAGLVKRTVERLPGRGRPRHLFEATDMALLVLFADNQPLLVPALWRAIGDIGGDKLAKKVLKRVGREMAEHYKKRVKGRTPRGRLRQLVKLLREEGGLVDVDGGRNGSLRIHKRSCPFFSMYEEMQNVCVVDREMMSLVVGAKVKRTACRHDGDPCCTFELVQKKGR